MKTRIQEQSLNAFPKAETQIGKVYEVFKKGYKLSYQNVADLTGLPIPTVVGRINSLRFKYGLIVADGKDLKNRNIYRLRKQGEPMDVEQEKNIEISAEILEILMSMALSGKKILLSYDKFIINGEKVEPNADKLFELCK